MPKAKSLRKAVVYAAFGRVKVGMGGKKAYAVADEQIRSFGIRVIRSDALYPAEKYREVCALLP